VDLVSGELSDIGAGDGEADLALAVEADPADALGRAGFGG